MHSRFARKDYIFDSLYVNRMCRTVCSAWKMTRRNLAHLLRDFRRAFVDDSGLTTRQAITVFCLINARIKDKPGLYTVIKAYVACDGSFPQAHEKFGIASTTYYRHLAYLNPDRLRGLVGVKKE